MKIALFAYTKQGMLTGKRIIAAFPEDEIQAYAPERIAGDGYKQIFSPSKVFFREQFLHSELLIFVGSCGIAVRLIAPHLESKETDPAVLCVDDIGKYVIPLLSGHIGGANEQAKKLAAALHAQDIITTATDIHQRFSVDSWASRHGYIIDNMVIAKDISAAILERDIPFCSQLPLSGSLPNGLYPDDQGKLGIFFGWKMRNPFERTLHIIPNCLHLGIGCRKGTSAQTIMDAVSQTMSHHHINLRAIKFVASIDLKASEMGLLEYCRSVDLPFICYSADELKEVQGEFTTSDFVRSVTGVDNVCERAAMMNANRLIVPKTIYAGVTVAAAAEIKEVKVE